MQRSAGPLQATTGSGTWIGTQSISRRRSSVSRRKVHIGLWTGCAAARGEACRALWPRKRKQTVPWGKARCHFRHRALAVHKETPQDRQRASWDQAKRKGEGFTTLEESRAVLVLSVSKAMPGLGVAPSVRACHASRKTQAGISSTFVKVGYGVCVSMTPELGME